MTSAATSLTTSASGTLNRAMRQTSAFLRSVGAITRHELASYFRSGWIFLDLLSVFAIYSVAFHDFYGDTTYFFQVANEALGALTIVATAILMYRMFTARAYLTLIRLPYRAAFVWGAWLTSATLRLIATALLASAVLALHRISGNVEPAQIARGIAGILLIQFTLAAVVILLMPPIGSRRLGIAFGVWLALALYAPHVGGWFAVADFPLWPLGRSLDLGALSAWDNAAILGPALLVAYIVALLTLASHYLAKRDLVLG